MQGLGLIKAGNNLEVRRLRQQGGLELGQQVSSTWACQTELTWQHETDQDLAQQYE